jgi:DNA-binding response OmpR family regulator
VEGQRLILVVEDDEPTRSFLLDNLAADGFRVAGAELRAWGRRPRLQAVVLFFRSA